MKLGQAAPTFPICATANTDGVAFRNNRTGWRFRITIDAENARLAGARQTTSVHIHIDSMKRFPLVAVIMLCFSKPFMPIRRSPRSNRRLNRRGFITERSLEKLTTEQRPRSHAFKSVAALEVTGELNEETLQALGLDAAQPVPTATSERSSPARTMASAARAGSRIPKAVEFSQSTQPEEQPLEANVEQIRDFAGFVVVGIDENVEAGFNFTRSGLL